ncbi:MAG: class I SAM-dependent methyltransferase [Bacteroidetes bacterium]|jgi:SAM-dependent methyltransferase|nr:class I SAM-dependent methyltransferase [Bacteroidota bacterium]
MNIRAIRNKCFRKWNNVDLVLSDMIAVHPSHAFLNNPPISNVYQYLADFVSKGSCALLNKDAQSLKVLDWGTGKGQVTYFLKKFEIKNTISCDIEEERHDSTFGQDHPIIDKANIKVDPLKHPWVLPYEDSSFDVVVSFGVLEHVPNDLESMKEINRVLKKGGLFFCFHLPRKTGWLHWLARNGGDDYHDRLYDKTVVKRLIEKSNFELLDVWNRSILPKNRFDFKFNHVAERLDLFFVRYTPLNLISTNVEFVAQKK